MSVRVEDYDREKDAKEDAQVMANKYRCIVEVYGFRKGQPCVIRRCYPPKR